MLKDQNEKQARKLAYMTDYSTHHVNNLLENEDIFECFCGGAKLQYYSKCWEESLKNPTGGLQKVQSMEMVDEA